MMRSSLVSTIGYEKPEMFVRRAATDISHGSLVGFRSLTDTTVTLSFTTCFSIIQRAPLTLRRCSSLLDITMLQGIGILDWGMSWSREESCGAFQGIAYEAS